MVRTINNLGVLLLQAYGEDEDGALQRQHSGHREFIQQDYSAQKQSPSLTGFQADTWPGDKTYEENHHEDTIDVGCLHSCECLAFSEIQVQLLYQLQGL